MDQKLLVVDDPFCSLDASRRYATKEMLSEMSLRAKQVILLSHDAQYLIDYLDTLGKGNGLDFQRDVAEFKIQSAQKCGSYLDKINLRDECTSQYYRDYKNVYDFANGNSTSVDQARFSIRPLLEGYLRYKYSCCEEFRDCRMMGEIITKIEKCSDKSPLSSLKGNVDFLRCASDMSSPRHHGSDPQVARIDDNENEVRNLADRTLKFIYRH